MLPGPALRPREALGAGEPEQQWRRWPSWQQWAYCGTSISPARADRLVSIASPQVHSQPLHEASIPISSFYKDIDTPCTIPSATDLTPGSPPALGVRSLRGERVPRGLTAKLFPGNRHLEQAGDAAESSLQASS